jgi:hypothetical protein
MVSLCVGWQRKEFDFAGLTVAHVAETCRESFNIQDDSDVFVNGEKVGMETVLKDGDNLEFLKVEGQKGCGKPDCPSCQQKK